VVLCVAASAQAQSLLARGDVLVQVASPDASVFMTNETALVAYAADGAKKTQLPWELETRVGLLAPAPDRILVSLEYFVGLSTDGATISDRLLIDSGMTNLGEIVAMRGGDFLVAERVGRTNRLAPRLVRFNVAGEILRIYELELIPRWSLSVGPAHMELLSDQCTLVYTLGDDYDLRRVMRYDVCAGRPMPDLLMLEGLFQYVGSIRQLPDGDLLIAGGHQVRRYDARGTQVAVYNVPALRIALTPDASGFWAVDRWTLQRIDFARPTVLADRVSLPHLGNVRALAVLGEWRAATNFIKRRPVRR
jgi:hypothetical protein